MLNWNPGSQERLDFTKLFALYYKIFRIYRAQVGRKLTVCALELALTGSSSR